MSILRNHSAARWDFDLGFRAQSLGSCFPRGITFADVDGETELNGRFLVIEGKRSHERLAGGQLYTNRMRVKDGRTVFVVYGDPPFSVAALQHFTWQANDGIVPANLGDLHAACVTWGAWADAQHRASDRANDYVPPFARSLAAA